jgi:flavin reductase (DIM6/NTAB) family NADH-FMN oxidoreductase RutF
MDQNALLKISYGLHVVGVSAEGAQPAAAARFGGCIVDALAQVSLGNPPVLVLGSMNNNLTNKLLKKGGTEFTLSVLPANVHPFVVANFGFQSAAAADKWSAVSYTVKDGLPLLDGACSYIRCRVKDGRELETHTAYFCDVIDAWMGSNGGLPLIYGNYQLSMRAAASEAFTAFKNDGTKPGANLI